MKKRRSSLIMKLMFAVFIIYAAMSLLVLQAQINRHAHPYAVGLDYGVFS